MILAAIQSQPQEADPLAGLRDNTGPVAVPWPEWVWWCIGAGAVILIAALIALGYWLANRKPQTVGPTARQIALRGLEALRAKAQSTDPYAFSVAVSDLLRTYVSGQFGLKATQQTSPEFLASISTHAFTDQERRLLAEFLERCDLLKFARITAREEENLELLKAATAFVQGARTNLDEPLPARAVSKTQPTSNQLAGPSSAPPSLDLQDLVAERAAGAVDAARGRPGSKLDYSPESMQVVEDMLEEASQHSEQVDTSTREKIVMMFAAYIHETARRQFGGKYYWHEARRQPVLVVGEPDFRIALLTNDRVQNRLRGAKEDNIPFFFSGFAEGVRRAKTGDDQLHV